MDFYFEKDILRIIKNIYRFVNYGKLRLKSSVFQDQLGTIFGSHQQGVV